MEPIDVLVAGELNVDIILNGIASFPARGKEILAQKMTLTLGSSSAIFASNLSTLGAKVGFCGKTGNDDFGQQIIQSLRDKGVNTGMIIQSSHVATGATVVLNYQEDRAMVTHPGAMEDFRLDDIDMERLARTRHLHFSSYFLQPGIQKDIVRLFRTAKESGLTTSFDAQWDPYEKWEIDLQAILPHTDLFFPNENELLHMTGTKSIPGAIDVIKDFANTVVIKRGNQGSVSWQQGKLLQKPAYVNRDVVDAIGAGDSFNAGFVYKFLQQASLEECQDFGNLTGAVSTTAPGGTTAFTSLADIMKTAKERFGYEG